MSSSDALGLIRIRGPTRVTSAGGVASPVEMTLYKRGSERILTINTTSAVALTGVGAPTWTHNWALTAVDLPPSQTEPFGTFVCAGIGAPTNAVFVMLPYLLTNTFNLSLIATGGGGAATRVIANADFDAAHVGAGDFSIPLTSISWSMNM